MLRTSRHTRLTPELIDQIELTVRRAPEVVIRILPAHGCEYAPLRKYVDAIARQAKHCCIESDYGQLFSGSAIGRRVMEHMDLDLEEHRCKPTLTVPLGAYAPRLVYKIIFSMPNGTCPQSLLAAVRDFLKAHFGSRYRYVFILQTHRHHPHVHAIVKSLSEDGVRLRTPLAVLRSWREDFAGHLRAQGVLANATAPALRGQNRVWMPTALHYMAHRAASTRVRARFDGVARELENQKLQAEPNKRRLLTTRRQVERKWRALHALLIKAGQVELAAEVLRFLAQMPAPLTDRELVANQVLSAQQGNAESWLAEAT